MKIHITKSKAEGLTSLAAFDTCLLNMGIGNQNLVYLSSIIPPDSEIIEGKAEFDDSHFGNKLYCVMAQKRVTIRNRQAWAGIGWVQDEKTGKGLFVEHTGHSSDEVQQDINNTLNNMIKNRPDTNWSRIHMMIEGIQCGDKPVCAMVAAVYQSEAWSK